MANLKNFSSESKSSSVLYLHNSNVEYIKAVLLLGADAVPKSEIFVRKETVDCVVAQSAAVQHTALEFIGRGDVALQTKLVHFAREKVVPREANTALTHQAVTGRIVAEVCFFFIPRRVAFLPQFLQEPYRTIPGVAGKRTRIVIIDAAAQLRETLQNFRRQGGCDVIRK